MSLIPLQSNSKHGSKADSCFPFTAKQAETKELTEPSINSTVHISPHGTAKRQPSLLHVDSSNLQTL